MDRDDGSAPFMPTRLTIRGFSYALDGGTIDFLTSDEVGLRRDIVLVQHLFLEAGPTSPDWIPGRLYFDGQLVPIRSVLESEVLALLRGAEVAWSQSLEPQGIAFQILSNYGLTSEDIRQSLTRDSTDNIGRLKTWLIKFVESAEYVRFPEQVEQARVAEQVE